MQWPLQYSKENNMNFNQQQQGFNMSPGGVPHGNMPAYPDAPVGAAMQPYLPVMAAKLYMDMSTRGTQYTNVMAQQYASNGYINHLFEDALVMLANLVEYSMFAYGRQFTEVIDSAVVDCNNALLENQHRSNSQLQSIRLTEEEKTRYRAAKSKMDSLRTKISEFLKRKDTNMNQPYVQPNQGGFNNQAVTQPSWNNQPQGQMQAPQMQSQGWGQPPLTPQQQQYLMQQQAAQAAHAHQQQQQMMYQQQLQQQNMQSQGWGQPQGQTQPGWGQNQAQSRGQDFINRVHQRITQPQGFNNNPFNGNAGMQQGWAPQPTNQFQGNMQGVMFDQYGRPMAPPNFNQPNQMGNLAVSGNQMQHQHQAPRASSFTSGFNPMPTIDESKLNQPSNPVINNSNVDPFARNSQIMQQHNQSSQTHAPVEATGNTNASFTQGASFSQPTQPNPSTSDMVTYEKRVRAEAERLGLPSHGSSLSYLEEAISTINPSNGFISKKNAYSEVKGFTNTGTPSGAYDGNQPYDDVVDVYNVPGGVTSESFATQMRNAFANKSDKTISKQANGRYEVINPTLLQAITNDNPGVGIDDVDVRRYKNNPPYDFAELNMEGNWVIPFDRYDDVKDKGLFQVPALYPVYSRDGFYVVTPEGSIIDFFSKPKTGKDLDMEFALHDDSRFFNALTKQDLKVVPNEAAMIETFVNLQTQQKVSDVVKGLESEAGVIEGDNTKLIINKTIELEEQVNGNISGDDYHGIGYSALYSELNDDEISWADINLRYKHVHFYPWDTDAKDMKVLRKLRYKEDYTEIAEILMEINEASNIPDAWFTRLNDVATRYVNYVIATQFPLGEYDTFHIDSFCLDITDAIQEMEELGYGEAFLETAARLTNTLLYVWDNTNPAYTNYMHMKDVEVDENEELSDENNCPGIGIVRDISVIPLHSRDIPLHTSKDKCLLTKQGFTKLWEIAKERIENRDARTTEIVIVTRDNRHMYINETFVPDVYSITKKSLLD